MMKLPDIDDVYQYDFLAWNFPGIGKTIWAQRGSSSNYCNFETRFTVIAAIAHRWFRHGETNCKLRAIPNILLIKIRQIVSRICGGNLFLLFYFLIDINFYFAINYNNYHNKKYNNNDYYYSCQNWIRTPYYIEKIKIKCSILVSQITRR